MTRADLDAVFRGRLDTVHAALAAARQVAVLRAEQRDVPVNLPSRRRVASARNPSTCSWTTAYMAEALGSHGVYSTTGTRR